MATSRLVKSLHFLLYLLSVAPALCSLDGTSLVDIRNSMENRDFPGSVTWEESNTASDPDPCGWAHVVCDADGYVSELDLSNLGLKASKLHKYFLTLSHLQKLDLSNNSLGGDLPYNFRQLNRLKYLDLSNNNFTGPIAADFVVMTNLTYLNLANNSFSGSVATNISQRFCLTYFENNPSLVINESNFIPCQREYVNQPPPPASRQSNLAVILGASVGGGLFLLLLLFICLYCLLVRSKRADKPKKLTPEEIQEIEAGLDNLNLVHVRRFTYDELVALTEDWKEVIGSGGTAVVYKGSLQDGENVRPIAVKRLKTDRASKDTLLQFCSEIDIISRAVHKHVTKLEGFCVTDTERILVFPYFHFGSVQDHLRGQKFHHNKPISLESRINIAIGTARGLAYLHDECAVKIIHRDVKAANVLLDNLLEPTVTDFGLAQLVTADSQEQKASKIAGTFGHIAPEYLTSGRISDKIDVYAFGVFLLELLTGLHAGQLYKLCDADQSILDWLLTALRTESLAKFLDIELRAKFLPLDEEGNPILADVLPLCKVAAFCMSPTAEARPPMSDVVRLLQGEGLDDARSKISEDVPESVLSWNVGYGQFNSLSQSMMSFITEEEATSSNVDVNSRLDIESRLR